MDRFVIAMFTIFLYQRLGTNTLHDRLQLLLSGECTVVTMSKINHNYLNVLFMRSCKTR